MWSISFYGYPLRNGEQDIHTVSSAHCSVEGNATLVLPVQFILTDVWTLNFYIIRPFYYSFLLEWTVLGDSVECILYEEGVEYTVLHRK